MSKSKFDEKWEKINDTRQLNFSGFTGQTKKEYIYSLDYPRYIWKYNQIVGYIVISVSTHDVWFELFLSLDKRFYADSKTKHFIQNTFANGLHFHVVSTDSDEVIHERIRKQLESIEKNNIRKDFHTDYESFDNIFPYVNIRGIMNNIE